MENYQFGKFSLQLSGDWRKQDYWRSFRKESVDQSALIVTDKDKYDFRRVTGDGWQWRDHHATFLLEGFPLFTVQLKAANEATVQGGCLGILYALLLSHIGECIGLHGVTVRCGGKTIILSAPSGTGKTTLSNLLQQYQGAEIINGDFALLSQDKDGRVIFEPTPFCGSSGICKNLRLPVDQIVFLRQGKENASKQLMTREACANLLTNVFVPNWDAGLSNQVLMNVFKMLEKLSVCQYSFLPDESAAVYFQQHIL